MSRAVILACASALLVLAPSGVSARGGGGHGGGGGGGGHGGGFGGGHAGPAGVHAGPMFGGHMGPAGPRGVVGFRAMPGAFHAGRFGRHVVAHRINHRKVFFIGGGDGGYYSYCYPLWNGYGWVSSCAWGY
jgi:hypothetical protein